MKTAQLTPKQKKLIHELNQISSLLRLNYRDIQEYERESRMPRLEHVRRHFVRGEIVLQYTLVDEFLNNVLCRDFFGRNVSFIRLWKTKKFKNFNYYFLEKLSLMEKLAYVKAVKIVPRAVAADVERLNNLRNGIGHAFFPENLRSAKPKWKGKDIFTFDGVKLFMDDMAVLQEFFLKKLKAWS